jgi:hypothetical protein
MEKTMEDTIDNEDDKGPTEKLRDEEKSESGELVPGEEGVPGAQKPDNEGINNEKGLNTE